MQIGAVVQLTVHARGATGRSETNTNTRHVNKKHDADREAGRNRQLVFMRRELFFCEVCHRLFPEMKIRVG